MDILRDGKEKRQRVSGTKEGDSYRKKKNNEERAGKGGMGHQV